MPNAGTLDVAINADPTGMVRGFGRSQQEIKKFERQLGSSTRSISGAFTNLAVDFAASGEVGARGMKRMAESAIGLAGLFGPGGILVSAVAGAGIALWNWHERAREEAEKTRERYAKMFEDLMGGGVAGVSRAAAEFERENAALINRLEQDIAAFQARQKRFQEAGGVGLLGFTPQITKLQDELKPLLATRKQFSDLAKGEANAAERLLEATTQVERATKARLDAERSLTREAERRARFAEEEMRATFALVEFHAANRLKVERMAAAAVGVQVTPGGMTPEQIRAIEENIRGFAQAWKNAQDEAEAYNNILREGAGQFSTLFANALTGSIRNFRDFANQILSIWQNILTQIFAAQLFSNVFGPLLGVEGLGSGIPRASPSAASAATPGLALAAAGGDTFHVNVGLNLTAMDGASAARVLQANQGTIAAIVVDAIRTSRQAQRDIRGG